MSPKKVALNLKFLRTYRSCTAQQEAGSFEEARGSCWIEANTELTFP